MKQKRKSNGQYRKSHLGKLLLLLIITIVGAGLYTGTITASSTTTYVSEQTVQVVEKIIDKSNVRYQEKINELKDELLTTLSLGCEVKGLEEPDGAIVFDSNNEASIGRFQFQRNTVIHYYKVLYNKEIGKTEAIQISIDSELSTQLAKDIIFTAEDGIWNWANCAKKYDLENQVNIIKKFE